MKMKILLWSVVSVLILGLAGGGYWWFSRPQIIVLGDGSQLTLLSVTYGKKHKLDKSQTGGRKVQNGTTTTTNDTLCVWIEQKHEQNSWPNYQLLAYDSANTACSAESTRTFANFAGNRQGDEVMGFVFSAFPRHGSRIYLRVKEWNNGQQDDTDSHFVIHNPAKLGSVAAWTPEKLPVTAVDGDLQATLTSYGYDPNPMNSWAGTAQDDPMNKGMLASFHIEQGGVLVTNWQPIAIESSDATGNSARQRMLSNHPKANKEGEQAVSYQWGLWPEEPAWKIKVEMSRTSGFNQDEVWTASGLPIKEGSMNDMWNNNRKDKPIAETSLGEFKLQIFPVVKLSENDARNYGDMAGMVRIHVTPRTDGLRMTMVKITDDKGNELEHMNRGGGMSDYRYSIKSFGEAKTLNITLALHRSRFFEYTVKPVAAK